MTLLPGRFGFHYFPDFRHYTEQELHRWLPELQSLGASWLTLPAPPHYALPEPFLNGLVNAGIEPIVHLEGQPGAGENLEHMRLLFQAYARRGVHYLALFDRPNLRRNWSASAWAQGNLVERFLDEFIPLANAALECGLKPVFPPLEPGGDYWDTAFLRAALRGIRRRGQPTLIRSLVLGAYAWAEDHPLDWGAGGPERWPGARPYHTSSEPDQRGFRIFDWYLALSDAELGKPCPILLLGTGSCSTLSPEDHAQCNLTIARLLAGDEVTGLEPVPSEVLAGNFWLLSAEEGSPHAAEAWFPPGGQPLPAVGALRDWFASHPRLVSHSSSQGPAIQHYLLLPSYDWGIADWHLEIIRPFVKKYRPTVGFSLSEAAHARRVTVVGGSQTFNDEVLDRLRAAGCYVERIDGDGTQIASLLASL